MDTEDIKGHENKLKYPTQPNYDEKSLWEHGEANMASMKGWSLIKSGFNATVKAGQYGAEGVRKMYCYKIGSDVMNIDEK